MNFDEIWPRFSWVLEEMRNGMCFFEGYIPLLGEEELLAPLLKLVKRAEGHTFKPSTWSSETRAADWDLSYDESEYVAFFESGKILTLHFDYETQSGNTPLSLKLMFDRSEAGVALEIICYRETILDSADPQLAVADAVTELRTLRRLFRGDALLLGPDTLDRPESATEYSQDWLRIE